MAPFERYEAAPESTDSPKSFREVLERTAQARFHQTMWYFQQTGKSFDDFVEQAGQAPFHIAIDKDDPKSVTLGIHELQKNHLHFPETDNRGGCDGMCGPITYLAFQELLVQRESRMERDALRRELPAPPPAAPPVPQPPEARAEEDIDESVEASQPVSIGRVTFFGDSLTDRRAGGMLAQPEMRGSVILEDAAVGGQQTRHMREAMEHALTNGDMRDVQTVVIFGGVNDLASKKSPEEIILNLDAMYQMMTARGINIVACTIPPWDITKFLERYEKRRLRKGWKPYPFTADQLAARQARVNAWIRGQQSEKIRIVDVASEVEANPRRYKRSGDGLHFIGEGYRNLGLYIADAGNIQLQSDRRTAT